MFLDRYLWQQYGGEGEGKGSSQMVVIILIRCESLNEVVMERKRLIEQYLRG